MKKLVALKHIVLLALSLGLASGCVSQQKFTEEQKRASMLEVNLAEKEQEVASLKNTQKEMLSQLNSLQNQLNSTTNDRKKLKSSVTDLEKAIAEMAERKQQAEKRVQQYRDLVKKFSRLIESGELNVQIVNGRMVLAMSSDILFPSGSAKLSSKGMESIEKVGQLLATLRDKKYQIEGHTDNVPISTSSYQSNWELATARALTVLKVLLSAGVAEAQLSAAGYADTMPVASNKTKEGRSKNRRIEIALVPDLSSLPGFSELTQASKDSSATESLNSLPDLEKLKK